MKPKCLMVDRRGAAAVEFSFIFMLLIVVIFGIIVVILQLLRGRGLLRRLSALGFRLDRFFPFGDSWGDWLRRCRLRNFRFDGLGFDPFFGRKLLVKAPQALLGIAYLRTIRRRLGLRRINRPQHQR